jgi:hypothetical protein
MKMLLEESEGNESSTPFLSLKWTIKRGAPKALALSRECSQIKNLVRAKRLGQISSTWYVLSINSKVETNQVQQFEDPTEVKHTMIPVKSTDAASRDFQHKILRTPFFWDFQKQLGVCDCWWIEYSYSLQQVRISQINTVRVSRLDSHPPRFWVEISKCLTQGYK